MTNQHDFEQLKWALHPVYARLLCAEMVRRGFAQDQIVAGSDLQWQTLHHSNDFIGLASMRALIAHCIGLTQCPWLGLEVGFKTQASAHGPLGAAMIACPNLPQAVLILQRYSRLRQNLATLNLPDSQAFTIELQEWADLADSREFLLGQLVAGLAQLFMTLTGQDLQTAIAIEWPFARPDWADAYQRVAHLNSFGHDRLRVVFSPALINSPSLAADAENLAHLLRECDAQLQRLQGGELSRRLRLLFAREHTHIPSLQDIAQAEHVSKRTLIRRLASEGASYQSLLDEVRFEKACWLLRQTDVSIESVAHQLGYEDASNFGRTFRRWSGQTPTAYRQQA